MSQWSGPKWILGGHMWMQPSDHIVLGMGVW